MSGRSTHRSAPRILGGLRRGLILSSPQGQKTRPTSVRARKALFDKLQHRYQAELHGTFCLLDAFAGCGALGLEALSRWQISRGMFFEIDPLAQQSLQHNFRKSLLPVQLYCLSALTPPRCPHDLLHTVALAFFDPPYHLTAARAAPSAFARQNWFKAHAVIVFQHEPPPKSALASAPNFTIGDDFLYQDQLQSGNACFSIFRYIGGEKNLIPRN